MKRYIILDIDIFEVYQTDSEQVAKLYEENGAIIVDTHTGTAFGADNADNWQDVPVLPVPE